MYIVNKSYFSLACFVRTAATSSGLKSANESIISLRFRFTVVVVAEKVDAGNVYISCRETLLNPAEGTNCRIVILIGK